MRRRAVPVLDPDAVAVQGRQELETERLTHGAGNLSVSGDFIPEMFAFKP